MNRSILFLFVVSLLALITVLSKNRVEPDKIEVINGTSIIKTVAFDNKVFIPANKLREDTIIRVEGEIVGYFSKVYSDHGIAVLKIIEKVNSSSVCHYLDIRPLFDYLNIDKYKEGEIIFSENCANQLVLYTLNGKSRVLNIRNFLTFI